MGKRYAIPLPLDLSVEEREKFSCHVKREAKGKKCWIWIGPRRNGYGQVWLRKRLFPVHRLAYALAAGVDPGAAYICHKCDITLCCNPDHLFAGTHTDNMQDASKKGRTKFGEDGTAAKLSDAQVYSIRLMRAKGHTLKAIAEKFEVTIGTVSAIYLWKIRKVRADRKPW